MNARDRLAIAVHQGVEYDNLLDFYLDGSYPVPLWCVREAKPMKFPLRGKLVLFSYPEEPDE